MHYILYIQRNVMSYRDIKISSTIFDICVATWDAFSL